MTINRFFIHIVCSMSLVFLACSVANAGAWIERGSVTKISIFPTYAVVYMDVAASPGPAGCVNDNSFSLGWSSFSDAIQNRVMSMLLAARTTKQTINVQVSTTACGPEGKKLFSGEIEM